MGGANIIGSAPVVGAVLSLALVGGCGESARDSAGTAVAAREGAAEEDFRWKAVQAYIDMDDVWHASERSARGEHPDITLAVAGAKEILAAADHPKRIDAAAFLAEHPNGMYETADEDMAQGREILQAEIGADWSVVDAYQVRRESWDEAREALAEAELEDDERRQRKHALGPSPRPTRANAAAMAILAEDGHAARRDAAAHLALNSRTTAEALAGAEALLAGFPDFDQWPAVLAAVNRSAFGDSEEVDQLLDDVAARSELSNIKATARYYRASRLAEAVNHADPAERDALRQQALALTTGLSAGLEEVDFEEGGRLVDGTFADAEADLVFRINHATAGGTLPEASGATLDGSEESLAAYAGKVVLIDFWATWCGPCVAALPKLRELHEKTPADRFAVLGVSVDEELETVTEFQEEEPMPWSHWHVGPKAALLTAWGVRGYPTYILVGGDGVILARTHALDDSLIALIEGETGKPALAAT